MQLQWNNFPKTCVLISLLKKAMLELYFSSILENFMDIGIYQGTKLFCKCNCKSQSYETKVLLEYLLIQISEIKVDYMLSKLKLAVYRTWSSLINCSIPYIWTISIDSLTTSSLMFILPVSRWRKLIISIFWTSSCM